MTFSPKITHTFPNGAVNVELTLTFSTGGPLIAEDIAEKMLEELLHLAGTRNVPAIPLALEETSENDDSPEEREMTRQGVGDFGDDPDHAIVAVKEAGVWVCDSCGDQIQHDGTVTTWAHAAPLLPELLERDRIARAAADLSVSAA